MIKTLSKSYVFAFVFSIILFFFTMYLLLDTFLISRIYAVVTSNVNNAIPKGTYTDTTYTDENINISIKKYRKYDTDIYVADIVLNDAKYLMTAFAKNTYGRNITEKTSTIASRNCAILAINGDFYGAHKKGYLLRNGEIYRNKTTSTRQGLVIYKNGDFNIIKECNENIEELQKAGAYNMFSFGPGLVINSRVVADPNSEALIESTKQPRTAIGKCDGLHYVFVVADGRTEETAGLTMYELACFMKDLEVQIAYNLDGGGSSTMYFGGKVINQPTYDGYEIKERAVSDIVYIGY